MFALSDGPTGPSCPGSFPQHLLIIYVSGEDKHSKHCMRSSLEGCWVGSFVLSGNLISPKLLRLLSLMFLWV